MTLHESVVIDNYGTQEEREDARKFDTDQHWSEVKDEWIESVGGIGGLSFLDKEGFKYYLPAYISWYLRGGYCSSNCSRDFLLFHLNRNAYWGYDDCFNDEQKQAICEFLEFLERQFAEPESQFDCDNVSEALDGYWRLFSKG